MLNVQMIFHELLITRYNQYNPWLRFAVTNIKRLPWPLSHMFYTCVDVHAQFDDFSSFKILHLSYRHHLKIRKATTSPTYKAAPNE